jgi:carbon storage regulator
MLTDVFNWRTRIFQRLLWTESGGVVAGEARSNGGAMLVLTRKTNQSIMIGDEVEVSVLAVSRDKIRLGIAAPREVPVFRKEVYQSIKEEQVAAKGNASGTVEHALDELSNDQ